MKISGFNKLCLLDYPGKIACILFTSGCNYKCPFCQNSTLINSNESIIEEKEILDFLKKRKNILAGVVVSGGEPTIQKDLKEFIAKIKRLGFKVKLDTNGSNPKILKELLDEELIDYVAMDIKDVLNNYSKIVGIKLAKVDNIETSIELIKNSKIDFEFRTTIIKEYHDIRKLEKICELVGKENKYYLQNFEMSDNVLNKDLHGFTDEEFKNIYQNLKNKYKNLRVRGLTNTLLKEEIKNV